MKQVVGEKKGYRSVYDNQCFGSGLLDSGSLSSTSGWIPIRIRFRIRIRIHGFDDQKWGKIYSWKKFDIFFYIKNCNLLIPRPPKRTSKLQGKPLSPHPALQTIGFLNFFYSCGPFLPSWIRIRNTAKNYLWLLAGEINVSKNLTKCCGEEEEIPSSSTSGSLIPTPCPFSTS